LDQQRDGRRTLSSAADTFRDSMVRVNWRPRTCCECEPCIHNSASLYVCAAGLTTDASGAVTAWLHCSRDDDAAVARRSDLSCDWSPTAAYLGATAAVSVYQQQQLLLLLRRLAGRIPRSGQRQGRCHALKRWSSLGTPAPSQLNDHRQRPRPHARPRPTLLLCTAAVLLVV